MYIYESLLYVHIQYRIEVKELKNNKQAQNIDRKYLSLSSYWLLIILAKNFLARYSMREAEERREIVIRIIELKWIGFYQLLFLSHCECFIFYGRDE